MQFPITNDYHKTVLRVGEPDVPICGGVGFGACAEYGAEIRCFVLFDMQPATRHPLQQYAADCFVRDSHFAAEQELACSNFIFFY